MKSNQRRIFRVTSWSPFIGTLIDDVPIFNFAFVVANAVVFMSDLTCRKHGASKRRYCVTVASR